MDRLGDAERLKRLYAERAPKGMNQEDFGTAYGIGNQSMVSQYLSGHRPLNIEAAAKFAKGLRCTIRDISPEMAAALEADVLPMLGARALKRVMAKMMLAVVAALFTIPPSHAADPQFDITFNSLHIALRRWLRRWWPSAQS